MLKKFTILLSLCTLSALCTPCFAQEEKTVTIQMPTQYGSCDVRELLKTHAPVVNQSKRRRAEAVQERTLWIDRITNLPEYLRDFYDRVDGDIQKVLDGKVSSLSMPELSHYDGDTYAYKVCAFTETFPFTYTSESDLQQKALEAVGDHANRAWDQFLSFIPYICLCINMDFPQAFWLNTTYSYFNAYSINYSYNPGSKTGNSTYEITMYFTLKSSDYDIRRSEFQSAELVAQGVERYKTAIETIFSGYPEEGTRYEKLLYLNDWLTLHNCYNSLTNESSRPDIAWSPLSALEGTVGENGPVCEGYSRAFKVLCDQKNIPCILASGWARDDLYAKGEPHMWNQVKMADGQWYAIDVTWNDPVIGRTAAISGGENHNWFLLGSDTEVQPGFTFSQSHPEDKTGGFSSQGSYSWSMADGPALSPDKYDPESAGEDPGEDPQPHEDIITLSDITDLIDRYLAQ